MEQNTALSVLRGLPVTKAEQKAYADKLKSEMLSGNFNPLDARIFLKGIIDTLQAVCDDKSVKDYIMEEAAKFGGKTFEHNGAKISLAGKKTYDFTTCGDPVYNQMVSNMNDLKEKIKAREAMLKTGIDSGSGEVFPLPATKTTEYITIEIL